MRTQVRWAPLLVVAAVSLGLAWTLFGARATAAPVSGPGAEEWRQVENWPQVPRWMKWESGAGVAVGPGGIVYYLARDSGAITKWDPETGKFLGHFGSSSTSVGPFTSHSPPVVYGVPFGPATKGGHYLRFEPDGSLWVVERDRGIIRHFTADGTKVLLTLGTADKPGETPTNFNGPTAVVTLPNGNLVVSDGYWNSRLIWFDKNGKFIKSVGKWGNGPTEFGDVHSVALDATRKRLIVSNECQGDLHYGEVGMNIMLDPRRLTPVCDESKNEGRLPIYDFEGNHLEDWPMGGPGHSWGVVARADRIYSTAADHVDIRDPKTGKIIGKVPDATNAHGIAMDESGDNIYIASIAPRQEPNLNWAPLRKFTRVKK